MEKSDVWGIQQRYIDANETLQTAPQETVDVVRRKMGLEAYPGGPPDTAPVRVVVRGEKARLDPGTVRLENGGEITVDGWAPKDLPLGYHTLVRESGEELLLIVSPGACHLPPAWRAWGWAVQLYGARSKDSWGMGDFADLRRLAEWTANLGGGALLVNPLRAVAPTTPQQPSPYFPGSRRFLSPLYLSIEEVPGADAAGLPLEEIAREGRALNRERVIDRDRVWRLKLAALERIWSDTNVAADPELARWRSAQGPSLDLFATWCALAEKHGANWRVWPGDLRHPDGPAVARFTEEAEMRVAFWSWLQWLANRQLTASARPLMMVQDLPIGFDPDGADAWTFQDLLADRVSVGAPPDEFSTRGQDWGLPPFIPWRLRQAAYRPFIETIRASMTTGGGLRIDHVMGLQRLFWIPVGSEPRAGVYVHYPADDLLAIVALESHRAGAVVAGEDLGTVDPAFREKLAAGRFLSYRLLWFEEHDPSEWPAASLGAVTTHDLPTVAGLWSGTDLAAQEALGLHPNEKATHALRARLAAQSGLEENARDEEAVLAAHTLLARAPSRLLVATLEDALAERDRPNIPGGDAGRANWSIPLASDLEMLFEAPLARSIAGLLGEALE